MYKRKEKAKTMGASLDKKEIVKEHIILSWIISDWRIKEILERKSSKNHWQPFLYFYCVSTFFYTVQMDTVYQKVLYNSCFFLFLRHAIQKTKEHILHKWGFIVFYSKK